MALAYESLLLGEAALTKIAVAAMTSERCKPSSSRLTFGASHRTLRSTAAWIKETMRCIAREWICVQACQVYLNGSPIGFRARPSMVTKDTSIAMVYDPMVHELVSHTLLRDDASPVATARGDVAAPWASTIHGLERPHGLRRPPMELNDLMGGAVKPHGLRRAHGPRRPCGSGRTQKLQVTTHELRPARPHNAVTPNIQRGIG